MSKKARRNGEEGMESGEKEREGWMSSTERMRGGGAGLEWRRVVIVV